MAKSYDEKLEALERDIEKNNERLQKKKEEKKRLEKLKNQEKRRKENSQKYSIGGMVQSIFKEKEEEKIRQRIEDLLFIKNETKKFLNLESDSDLVEFFNDRSDENE
ncbi:hypothetical protein [Priestia flexa]|uniref:hypothetical protein n=1 Tax=Priestia flexa TaxID=86664 RepID=UPI003FD342E5